MRGDAGQTHIDAADLDAPAVRRPEARQRLDELALTVAGDAGDADDLAAANDEIGAIDRGLAGGAGDRRDRRPRGAARRDGPGPCRP